MPVPRRSASASLPVPALVLAVVLGGCAGPGILAPAGALRYGPPEGGRAVYEHADTAVLDLSAGGQAFAVTVASASTWAMAFEPAGEGVRVSATLTALDARVDDPLGGARRADAGDVEGPLVFTLDPRGAATLESRPGLGGRAPELFSVAPYVHHLFPRLPGTAVAPGATWADTIAYTLEEAAGSVDARVALSYTAVGDTVVDGRGYLLVRYAGTDRRNATGQAGGMDFSQVVEGPVEGSFLWDVGTGALHALTQVSELRGTMEVPMSPAPLSVRVRDTTRVRRVPGR